MLIPFPPLLLSSGVYFILFLGVLTLLTLITSTFGFQPYLYSSLLMLDHFSVWLSFVTFLVVFCSIIVFYTFTFKFSFFMGLVSVASLGVFCSHNLLLLYMLYEFSLIPIVYIIMHWGTYPDRGLSSLMMILYTSFFSLPLMGVLFFFYPWGSLSILSSSLGYLQPSSGSILWFSAIVFLAFSVKLPLYGFHFWLPMAHVEAPTPGSMVLAGVLLKLGGCGLYRFSMVFPLWSARYWLLSYSIVCTIFVSFVAFSQSDFKRLIAYSSVVHMSVLVVALLAFYNISFSSFLIIMVCHGFSSPMMFLLVGSVYNQTQSRLIVLLRGLLLSSPLLALALTIAFLSNIPTPPLSSFIAEVMLFLGLGGVGGYMGMFIIFYAFLAVLFNVFWYTSVTYGPSMTSLNLRSSCPISFCDFISLVTFSYSLLMLVPLLTQF